MVLEVLTGIISSIVMTPVLMFFLIIISVLSFGKAFGLRRLYVNSLLKMFEYGRLNIERARRQDEPTADDVDEGDEEKSTEIKKSPQPVNNAINKYSDIQKASPKLQNGTETPKVAEDRLVAAPPKQNGNMRNGYVKNENSLISKNAIKLAPDMSENYQAAKTEDTEEAADKSFDFDLENCLDYVKAGMEAIIEDDVTSRFEAEEIKNWNLLTRTNRKYEFISWRLTVIWVCGFFIRYVILMPIRVFICFIGVMWLTLCTAVVGTLTEGDLKRRMVDTILIHCFGLLSSALSAVITYHNEENRPKKGICVANHTSPIDALVLMCDNCYSLIGQRHGGFLGVLQMALSRASPHIWFERAEAKDRHAVAQRLREHVSDPRNPPILIFPEGTCINNTSVMQFKKGSFEVGGVIYPVAIKYDPRFGDAFWNSAKYSMMQHLFLMMTSWAIVCDVWYLPPMYQQEDESAIDFANRVKSVIAKQGGLVDLIWDGQLKRMKPKEEWKQQQQEEFTKRLKGE